MYAGHRPVPKGREARTKFGKLARLRGDAPIDGIHGDRFDRTYGLDIRKLPPDGHRRTRSSRPGVIMDFSAVEKRIHVLAARRDRHGKGLLEPVGLRQWRAHLAGNCTAPFERRLIGAVNAYSRRKHRKSAGIVLTEEYRCGKCGPCREHRRKTWMARAVVEHNRSARSWMVTFTLSPAWQAELSVKADKLYRQKHANADLPTSKQERLDLKMRVLKRLIGRWLRVLAGPGSTASKRAYVLVAELHKSGEPHFHMLIHEREAGSIFRDEDCHFTRRGEYFVGDESRAKKLWRFGFCRISMCKDEAGAVYVMKYLAKTQTYRVAASQHYGAAWPDAGDGNLVVWQGRRVFVPCGSHDHFDPETGELIEPAPKSVGVFRCDEITTDVVAHRGQGPPDG